MAQQIEKVGVLGAGLMGHGIAQVAAQSGYQVVLREVDEATLAKGVGKIEKQLVRAVEKGKSSQEDADAIRARLTGTTDYADLADSDLVIEAITENLALKLEMWEELDAIVKAGGVPVRSQVGHSFIKKIMRDQNIPFGGEHSGHFYFKKNWFADSGMIALMQCLNVFSRANSSVSSVIAPRAVSATYSVPSRPKASPLATIACEPPGGTLRASRPTPSSLAIGWTRNISTGV